MPNNKSLVSAYFSAATAHNRKYPATASSISSGAVPFNNKDFLDYDFLTDRKYFKEIEEPDPHPYVNYWIVTGDNGIAEFS